MAPPLRIISAPSTLPSSLPLPMRRRILPSLALLADGKWRCGGCSIRRRGLLLLPHWLCTARVPRCRLAPQEASQPGSEQQRWLGLRYNLYRVAPPYPIPTSPQEHLSLPFPHPHKGTSPSPLDLPTKAPPPLATRAPLLLLLISPRGHLSLALVATKGTLMVGGIGGEEVRHG